MAGPCEQIRVLDFTDGMAGGLATAVLADFGADVIKVEPLSGDPSRSHPAWVAWNRGKRSFAVDFESVSGQAQLKALVRTADAVIESFAPGTMARWGLDFETLSREHPALIYASISGWGQHGALAPAPAYEGLVAAKSGRMASFAGQPEREGPAYAAVQVATWAASQAAVRGVLAALMERDRGGAGQWVQTSLLQGVIPYDFGGLLYRQFSLRDPQQFPPDAVAQMVRLPMLQYIPVRTKDGRWLQHANLMTRLFEAHMQRIGLGWVLEEERFQGAPNLTEARREELREIILARMQEKTLDEWMSIYLEDGNIAAEPYLQTVDGMQHEQYIHNHHAVEIDDPRVGRLRTFGLVADLAQTPGRVGGPAPELGADTEAILTELSARAVSVPEASQSPAPSSGAAKPLLDGITVLDFSMVLAGPYAAAMLGEMGARVIKVDATPEREQASIARSGPNVNNLKTYAGKESLQIDLQTAEGKAIIKRWIAQADVLLHNFRPGVPERLGIDWETCRAINPRLVHTYIGAYGATGPHNRRPGAHPIPGALFGGALRQAGSKVPPPSDEPLDMDQIKEVSRWLMRANEGNPDPNSSQAIATAIMLALFDRARNGAGQQVEVTMMQANVWANADEAYDYRGRPDYAVADAECYGLHALHRLYPAASGWVFLEVRNDREWHALCEATSQHALLSDERFASEDARKAHDSDLASLLGKLFATKSADDWEAALLGVGVGCVRADETMGWFFSEHEQAIANGLQVEVDSPRFGHYLRHGPIVTFSGAPNRFGHGSFGGEHTVALMKELGFSDGDIERMRGERIIDWEATNRIAAAV